MHVQVPMNSSLYSPIINSLLQSPQYTTCFSWPTACSKLQHLISFSKWFTDADVHMTEVKNQKYIKFYGLFLFLSSFSTVQTVMVMKCISNCTYFLVFYKEPKQSLHRMNHKPVFTNKILSKRIFVVVAY